ncbi:MAG TPA: KR domain-containing protein, partial [Chromatiales bacterium]|nr:KR domain-containing protein [Chromatiales bacterium]HEX22201.1 KR domain-containing protein [Chromatiales bacterium]
SSLASVLGGLGFGAYAAANAYLDAYAATKNQHQFVPWICLNWDGWDFSGGQAGDYLLPEEGVEVMRRVLHRRIERAAISVTALDERLRQWVYLEAMPTAPQDTSGSETSPSGSVQHHERPSLSSPYLEARNDTESVIIKVWEDLLGIQPIGVNDNYFELGGHSLLAIQIASRLHDHFHIKLAVQALFETPTVAELAQHIEQELGATGEDEAQLEELLSRLEQLSDEEVQALLDKEEG